MSVAVVPQFLRTKKNEPEKKSKTNEWIDPSKRIVQQVYNKIDSPRSFLRNWEDVLRTSEIKRDLNVALKLEDLIDESLEFFFDRFTEDWWLPEGTEFCIPFWCLQKNTEFWVWLSYKLFADAPPTLVPTLLRQHFDGEQAWSPEFKRYWSPCNLGRIGSVREFIWNFDEYWNCVDVFNKPQNRTKAKDGGELYLDFTLQLTMDVQATDIEELLKLLTGPLVRTDWLEGARFHAIWRKGVRSGDALPSYEIVHDESMEQHEKSAI